MSVVIILGLLASVLVVALGLSIQQKSIAIMSVTLSLVTGLQYLLLDRYFTAALTVVTILYGLLLLSKRWLPWADSAAAAWSVIGLYGVLFVGMNGISLDEEILALAASVSGIALMAVKSPLIAKWMMFANGLTWTAYQLISGAYGQIPGEVFFMASVIFSLILLYRARCAGVNLRSVPELPVIVRRWFGRNRTVESPISTKESVNV